MVESSGGNCRCTCQEDFQDAQEPTTGCCSPHVFTSVLLGILSCVLMTGGVFLAFHKWDPMWLMVSGVGVVLILIGTILHCCHNMSQRPKRHSIGGKTCCSRPIPPDHSGHIVTNNGSLTEQLLPLSNARSVSQLSLNMLPGYFPPVVTAYGIEQHSAVVQNINRIVQQQQQQQQQQQPQTPGSCSPGVASTAGKSFIVLSLPSDTSTANIQNLVATVYQIDGNGANESSANETSSNVTSSIPLAKPNPTVPLILKNAEVQTCNMWPAVDTTPVPSTSADSSAADILTSNETTTQVNEQPANSSMCSGTTQTDDIPPISDAINLMDCSSDIAPICDTSTSACDDQPADHSALVNIPLSSSVDLIDVTLPTVTVDVPESSNSILIDIPDPASDHVMNPTPNVLVDITGPPSNILPDHPDVLIDISEDSGSNINSNNATASLGGLINNDIQQDELIVENIQISENDIATELSQSVPEIINSNLLSLNTELLSSNSNLSAVDTDIDDGELLERSSPPPSYEDVTLEGENGAFGLAYGTI